MAGIARLVAPGIPHHLTRRGNRRQKTSFVDGRRKYLSEDPPLEDVRLLRRHESTGRRQGSEELVRQLEEASGRILRKARPGPKPANERG
jgi:hypothetical protein